MQKTKHTDHVQIQAGAFRAFVLPENVTKIEEKLAKVKPPVYSIPKPSARDRARVFPAYKPGMSTAEYVRQFERANGKTGLDYMLNEHPAAEYDPNVPLCVEDANPDYIAGVDDAPVKAKRGKRDPKTERIKALEFVLTLCLHEMGQILPLIDDAGEFAATMAKARNVLMKG